MAIITPITKRQCHHPGNRPMCGAVMQDVGSVAEGQSLRRLKTSLSSSISICQSTFPLKNFTYPVAQASRHGTGLGEGKAEGSTPWASYIPLRRPLVARCEAAADIRRSDPQE